MERWSTAPASVVVVVVAAAAAAAAVFRVRDAAR